jgi:hypothetical protein
MNRAAALATMLTLLLLAPRARADGPHQWNDPPEATDDEPASPPAVLPPDRRAPVQAPVVEAASPAPLPEARRPRKVWYGWQTLLSDAVALTFLADGANQADRGASRGTTELGVGAAIFAGVPPIIHLAHERPGAFAASLAMRGLPILWLASDRTQCGQGWSCTNAFVDALAVLTLIAAVPIDAAALAREPAPKGRALLAPRVALRPEGGFDVGIGGSL